MDGETSNVKEEIEREIRIFRGNITFLGAVTEEFVNLVFFF